MATKFEPMTDQQVTQYVVSRESLLPLTKGQRAYLAAQIKAPLTYNPNSSDKAVAGAVVASWSREAVVAQKPMIAVDLAVEEWFNGDPEVPTQSPARTLLATFFLATMAALCAIGIVLWIFL